MKASGFVGDELDFANLVYGPMNAHAGFEDGKKWPEPFMNTDQPDDRNDCGKCTVALIRKVLMIFRKYQTQTVSDSPTRHVRML
jgi:hypothetical protein